MYIEIFSTFKSIKSYWNTKIWKPPGLVQGFTIWALVDDFMLSQ